MVTQNLLSRFYCNKRLKEIYHEESQKQKPNIPHKFLLLFREYEDKEQKQVKEDLVKEKAKA